MRLTASFLALFCASPALAAPNVLTDIAPIHGLVTEVMGDLGTPQLLLPPEADAHHYALRPSDARALSQSDLVIWVGAGLTPWLTEPLATLSPDAQVLALLGTDGWEKRELHHGEDDHGAHDHGDIDPHAWLSPAVATVWLANIAQSLAEADPENARTYAQNAEAAAARFATLDVEIKAVLADVPDQTLIWPHDAYGYFADSYGLASVGAIAEGDASDPGPAHIAELREMVTDGQVTCVLLDPEINEKWAQVLIEGTQVQTAAIDPIGAGIPQGRGFYRSLMLQMAHALASCR